MADGLALASDLLIAAGLALLPVALVVDGILLAIALGAALLSSWRERSCERSTERAIRRDFHGHVAAAWAELPDGEKRRIREQAIFREEAQS